MVGKNRPETVQQRPWITPRQGGGHSLEQLVRFGNAWACRVIDVQIRQNMNARRELRHLHLLACIGDNTGRFGIRNQQVEPVVRSGLLPIHSGDNLGRAPQLQRLEAQEPA